MNDGIAFQSVLVTVMINRAAQCVGIYSQVSHAHGLEKESECIKVVYQVFGA